jgi:hypothetical protein
MDGGNNQGGKRMQTSKMSIHLQMAAIFKRFELRGWDWVHFSLCFQALFRYQ